MSNIKFRIWDVETEQFYYTDKQSDFYSFGFENGTLKCYVPITKYPSDPLEPPYTSCYEVDGDMEQFTGRLDKNGKEIYESDTIRYVTIDDILAGEISVTSPKIDDGMSDYFMRGWIFGSRNQNPSIWGEVIGNVHEDKVRKLRDEKLNLATPI